MDNPVNISGQLLEDMVENYCVSNKISYKRAKPGAHEIDFIIYKWYPRPDLNRHIVKGNHKISPKVLEHCNEMARGYNFELHFVNYEQFTNKLVAKEEGFFG